MGFTLAIIFMAFGGFMIIAGIAMHSGMKHEARIAPERDAPVHRELRANAVLAPQPLGTPRPQPKPDPKTEAERAADKGLNDVVAGWLKWARADDNYTKTQVKSLDDMDALVRERPPLTATVTELQAALVRLRGAIDAAEVYRRTEALYAAQSHIAARITLLREDTYDPSACEDLYYLTHTDPAVVQAYIKGTEEGMGLITKEVIAARAGIRTAIARQVTGRGQAEALKALVHELALRDPKEEWAKLYDA